MLVEERNNIEVAPYAELVAKYGDCSRNWEVVDCTNKLLMPGLVDGHNHLIFQIAAIEISPERSNDHTYK